MKGGLTTEKGQIYAFVSELETDVQNSNECKNEDGHKEDDDDDYDQVVG